MISKIFTKPLRPLTAATSPDRGGKCFETLFIVTVLIRPMEV